MTDSDSDSFHSASEGEDLEIEEPEKPISKESSPSTSQKKAPELEKTVESIYDDAEQSVKWTNPVPENPTSPELEKPESPVMKTEEGWEDFGDEADSEGDSEVERVESDEGEYYHRQMRDRKLMPPPPLPEREERKSEPKTSGGLFDWTAIHSVVSAVGEGISNAVESGLGLPPPEEAARLSVAERRKILEDSQKMKEPEPSLSSDEGGVSPEGSIHGLPIHHARSHSQSGFSSLLGGFGSIVNGSLDVLETLGKKTFETLTIKDESEKRRFILQPEKGTNLSDILRELKESEDAPVNSPKMMAFGNTTVRNTGISFLKEFEDNDGLVHLECFELLSKDYFAEKVANKQFIKFDDRLAGFCLEDVSECSTDEFSKGIKKQMTNFNGYKPNPMTDANTDLTDTLTHLQSKVDRGETISVDEFHRLAIVALAKLTAKAIECLCRLIQQMIVSQKSPDLDSVFTFTYLVCRRLSFFTSQYANLLSLLEQTGKVEEAITNIFFECSNACLYLKKALELARPFFPDDGFIFNPKTELMKFETQEARKPESQKSKKSEVKKGKSTSSEDGEWENW
ncbi:hypothetical protein FO519_003484 [Halicephalobus sp. NKZ332]|nr:hypothetical protein FO519_003484 [Halicephalobus sp. NKZ332]